MSKSGGLSKVLYGELNEEILSAQTGSLQKAGYQVQTAVGRAGVLDALKRQSFELVILGATLTRDDRHHLPYMAKKASLCRRKYRYGGKRREASGEDWRAADQGGGRYGGTIVFQFGVSVGRLFGAAFAI
jgi:hypothetical protein